MKPKPKLPGICKIFLVILSLACMFPQQVMAAVYPSEVKETIENGYYKIIKTYALTEDENPDEIPTDGFEREGVYYKFTDIVKKENSTEDHREHTEIVTLDTATQNINDIISQLAPTMEFEQDGYTGALELDLATIQTVEAGRTTSTYEVTETREYPNLSASDLSLIPKTIENGGKTYKLADADFVAQKTANVDYADVPVSYKAIAKYTATASSSKVTGYTTTAEYKGVLTKTTIDKTYYTVSFTGGPVAPEPEPEPEPEITPEPEPTPKAPVYVDLYSVMFLTGTGIVLGGVTAALYFVFGANTTLYNEKDGKFVKIGKVKISPKNKTADLKRFIKKAHSRRFILELSNFAYSRLKSEVITVKFDGQEVQHTVDPHSDMKKYQFEANFE